MPVHLCLALHVVLTLHSSQSLLFNHNLWYKDGILSFLLLLPIFKVSPLCFRLVRSSPWLTLQKHLCYLHSCLFFQLPSLSFLMDSVVFPFMFPPHPSKYICTPNSIQDSCHWPWPKPIPFRLFSFSLYWSHLLCQIRFPHGPPSNTSSSVTSFSHSLSFGFNLA